MTRSRATTAAAPPWPHRWFFPAAALYAAIIVPISVQGMLGEQPWLPALARPAWHARELLYGFALAVVSGYLVSRRSPRAMWLIYGAWLAARLAWVVAPGGMVAGALQLAFVGSLAWNVVPKFIGSGRKLRNLAIAPLLLALALSALAFDIAGSAWPGSALSVATGTVLLLGWLMAFMGGRLIAPAVAGQLGLQGEVLEARVQPRIEGAIIIVLTAAVVLSQVPATYQLAGMLAVAAGGLIAVRMFRWRFWRCEKRIDLWCLCVGYGWLAVGLAGFGLSLITGRGVPTALHLITVGALGTLTFNVMLRTHVQRAKGSPKREWLAPVGTLLIALAALARFAASDFGETSLVVAASAWSLAYLLLVARLLLPVSRRARG